MASYLNYNKLIWYFTQKKKGIYPNRHKAWWHMVLFAGPSYFRVRVSSSACTKRDVQYKTSSVKCTSTSWNLHAAILDLWIQPLVVFFFTENKDSTNYENPTFYCPMFASQCDVIFYCIVFLSLCKFCTDLKNFLDCIQHFFLLFIFFLKRNNHFWRYHKRKKLFDVNSKKERRVSCFTPN